MSCATLSAQPIRLTVTVGNLPEGYCPATFQQFANDFAARLIVTPNQNNSTFVTGSVEPTSNVGPWLKNCEEWFVFDDATGRYRPETTGVFKNLRYYTSNDNFIVPDNIYKIKVHIWGGGGGGSAIGGGSSGGGGGGGGYGLGIFDVIPGQNVALTIGTGGAAGGATGGTGGATTVLTMTANGGAGGAVAAGDSSGGIGGSVTGATFGIRGGAGNGAGNGGGGGITTTTTTGIGGGSPQGGPGGMTHTTLAQASGVVPGGGGAGQSTSAAGVAGNGGGGAVLIEY